MKFQFLKNLFIKPNPVSSGEVLGQAPYGMEKSTSGKGLDKPTSQSDLLISQHNHPDQDRNKVEDTISFLVIREMNGSRFELDSVNRISRVTWIGNVNLHTAKELLTLGADSVELDGYDKLILDRSELIEFDTEAIVWVKGLLKSRAKRIVKHVSKLAMINANSAQGSVFSNFIAPVISMALPDLNMRRFDTAEESIPWLLSE